MITEREFNEALRVINDYKSQVNKQANEALKKANLHLTCGEFAKQTDMSTRLYTALCHGTGWKDGDRIRNILRDKPIMSIKRKEFLAVQNAGGKTWQELCFITGKDEWE